MRALCNLLVGLPIFGVIIGAVLLIVQDLSKMSSLSLLDCDRLAAGLPFGLESEPAVVDSIRWLCGLPLGGHIVLASIVLGCITVPMGLAMYKSKGFDSM